MALGRLICRTRYLVRICGHMRKLIRNSIVKLLKVFSEHPDIFLTESDVRCYLFLILVKNSSRLIKPEKTKDNSFSIPIHSEVDGMVAPAKIGLGTVLI